MIPRSRQTDLRLVDWREARDFPQGGDMSLIFLDENHISLFRLAPQTQFPLRCRSGLRQPRRTTGTRPNGSHADGHIGPPCSILGPTPGFLQHPGAVGRRIRASSATAQTPRIPNAIDRREVPAAKTLFFHLSNCAGEPNARRLTDSMNVDINRGETVTKIDKIQLLEHPG